MIYIYTGDGAGKTTSALGLALRSIGQGRKVVMIQFLKFWKNTGEYKIQKKLSKNFRVYQFGRKAWLKISKEKSEFADNKFKVKEEGAEDRKIALEGLKKAEEILKEKIDLLILDEICLACDSKILKNEEVLEFLDKVPEKIDVVLTGRRASPELIARADVVNTIMPTKFPEIPAKKGMQY